MSEWTEEQNAIIGERFDGLMYTVFELIDEMYKKDEEQYTAGEKKFYDAFHDYIWALNIEENEDEEPEKDI